MSELPARIAGRLLCQKPAQKIPASAQGKTDTEGELVTKAAGIHGGELLALFQTLGPPARVGL